MNATTARKATSPAEAPAAEATVTAPVQNIRTSRKEAAAKKAAAAKAPAKNRVPGRGTTLERLTAGVPTDKAELADHIGTARWAIRRAEKAGNAELKNLAEVRLAQLLRVKAERKAEADADKARAEAASAKAVKAATAEAVRAGKAIARAAGRDAK